MKKFKTFISFLLVSSVCLLSGCSVPSYDGFQFPPTKPSELKPAADGTFVIQRDYTDILPSVETTIKTAVSSDGLCRIEKKASYYDVILDYEKGSPAQIGNAYAEVIQDICSDYGKIIDEYIFEMTGNLTNEDISDTLAYGAMILKNSLDKKYQEELDAYAQKISGGLHGVKDDGKMSYEEAVIMNMVPDLLRATACSTITANGNKTQNGKRISARLLEWSPGSKRQLTDFHSVVHFKNGLNSITTIGLLGMFDVLTAINSNGVMFGILDVGSKYDEPLTVEGKTCYSYDIRKAAESCTTARQAAEYLCSNSKKYTYNANFFITDNKDAYCVESAVTEKDGDPIIRDENTQLLDGLKWSDPDVLCVVNSFVTSGNADKITDDTTNLVRWLKYDQLFSQEKNKISIDRFKALLTSEKTVDSNLINFRSSYLIHMVVLDYDTKKAQAVFAGAEVTDDCEWVDLGSMF